MGVVTSIKNFIGDGLANVVSGIGTNSDKRSYNHYILNSHSAEDLSNAYRTSWIARKIHDLPPYDATRAWREWQAEKNDITKIEAEEKRLKLRWKVRRALFLARLFGGSAMVIGVKGNQNPMAPLNADNVGNGGLAYVHVLNRHQLTLGELETNINNPYFMQPTFYELTSRDGQRVRVHPSRVIPFIGQPIPEGVTGFDTGQFWGDPLWFSLQDAVKNADFTNNEIAALMHEAKVDVIRIPGFMDHLSTAEYEARFLQRLALAQRGKSNHNALLMDAEEEYEQKQVNFAGLPEVAKIMLLVASGAADIPATRFLGQSPQGMNATGESDLRNYYDSISSKQENEIGPVLEPLDDLLIRSALGSRPADLWFEWSSLWQLSDVEKADRDKKNAETVTAYANSGLLPTDALAKGVQNLIIEHGVLPGFEDALAESDGLLRIEVGEEREDENAELDLELKRKQVDEPTEPPARRAANDEETVNFATKEDLAEIKQLISDALTVKPVMTTLEVQQPPKTKKVVVRDEQGLIIEIKEVEDNG